jgi:hypothetical protein
MSYGRIFSPAQTIDLCKLDCWASTEQELVDPIKVKRGAPMQCVLSQCKLFTVQSHHESFEVGKRCEMTPSHDRSGVNP